ncbi:MAG: helix-turn-helix transcriptional regulator [Reyranella sp.]
MTNVIRASSSSSPLTTDSAFRRFVEGCLPQSTPATSPGRLIQWAEFYQGTAEPIPDGFEDIDAIIEARERDEAARAGLQRARARLSQALKDRASPLAVLRLQRGWSQKQLAEAIGTSQPHIARIENGRDNVMLETANQLARALNVSLEEINAALGYGRQSA